MPNSSTILSLDYLICPEKGLRDCDSQRPGGVEIDGKIVYFRQFHGYIARLAALENFIDKAGRTPELG